MKAYIEVSFINRSVDQGYAPTALVEKLRIQGYEPVLGQYGIYELAKCFLNVDNIPRGRNLLAFVDDLSPTFHWHPRRLMALEVERLRYGAAVLPFLDNMNHVSTLAEVRMMRGGSLSTDFRRIIESRESDIAANAAQNDDHYIQQVAALRAQSPGNFPRFRTYEDVITYFNAKLHEFVEADVNGSRRIISIEEAQQIARRIQDFPAIRTYVRAHMYLLFHCLAHRTGAGHDKLGDYRHVAEAAYCQAMATADRQLEKIAPKINPSLRVLSFEALWSA